MAKSSRGMSAKDYKIAGTTFDGVRILAPKEKATSFTTAEIRAAVAQVLSERDPQLYPAPKKTKPKTKPKSVSGT